MVPLKKYHNIIFGVRSVFLRCTREDNVYRAFGIFSVLIYV